MANILLSINLYTCIALVGLIWTIQLVHYPSFNFIDKESFTQFISFHGNRISIVVIPLMLLELGSSIGLLFYGFKDDMALLIISLVLVIFIWGVTLFISSPIHMKLALGFDQALINKLILTNWYRTIAWTVRSLILFYLMRQV